MLSFLKNRFQKVKQALLKTHSALSFRLSALVGKPWNDETFEELEHILYEADLGSECINELISHLRSELRLRPMQEMGSILELLKQAALKMIPPPESPPLLNQPHIILVVGVNGSGKTTTISNVRPTLRVTGRDAKNTAMTAAPIPGAARNHP